jgi:hypothetical protein
MIEILAHCASREDFVKGMTTTHLPDGSTLCTLDGERLVPAPGVVIIEIGEITKPLKDEKGNIFLNEDGSIQTKTIGGFHVNLCAMGPLEAMLTAGLEQYDKEGNLKSVFERTHILALIPGMKFAPITEEGVPDGYEGPNGVRLFDPAAVKNRASVIM